MSIGGSLADFPLPEVLLLIGHRTGRLRLFDLPEYGDMELDLSDGVAYALHLGGSALTETHEVVAELSVIVQAGAGRFEFRAQPVDVVHRETPLLISNMVMLLVMHVDSMLARQNALLSPEHYYELETPLPNIWIDPNLNLFFQQTRDYLAAGVRAEDLAAWLGLENDVVRLNLGYLRQLGFVKLMDEAEIKAMQEQGLQEEISQKNQEFQLAAEASDLIRRTGKLLKLPSIK